jgi:hypothetical protein
MSLLQTSLHAIKVGSVKAILLISDDGRVNLDFASSTGRFACMKVIIAAAKLAGAIFFISMSEVAHGGVGWLRRGWIAKKYIALPPWRTARIRGHEAAFGEYQCGQIEFNNETGPVLTANRRDRYLEAW